MPLSLIESKYPDARPEYLEAWVLQNYIKSLKEDIKEQEEKLAKLLKSLTMEQNDKVFAVIGMKQKRTINPKALKEHRPDLWKKYGKLSDKAVGKIFTECMTMEETIAACRHINEKLTDENITVSITDLEKGITKAEVRKLPEDCIHRESYGTDMHLEIRPEYVAKLERFNPYPTHEELEGEDE